LFTIQTSKTKLKGENKMAIKKIYSCDLCDKVLNLKNNPSEFFQTTAVEMSIDVSIAGFVGEGCYMGHDKDELKILLCKPCFKQTRDYFVNRLRMKLMNNKVDLG
jgi:hypothetical protein